MCWIQTLWSLIVEPLILFSIVGLLIKIFVTNSKKIDLYTEKMWESTKKSQAFLLQIDHEFDVMNMCAKSIKSVFMNFGKIYKDITDGTKTVDEAIRDARSNMPEELRKNFSGLFFLTEDSGTESTAMSQGVCSSSDLEGSKSRPVLSDAEKPSQTILEKVTQENDSAAREEDKKTGGTVSEVKA